jgi:hypothetical protein
MGGNIGPLAGVRGEEAVVVEVVAEVVDAGAVCGGGDWAAAEVVIVVVCGEFEDAGPAGREPTPTSGGDLSARMIAGPAELPAALFTSDPTRTPNDSSAITTTAATLGGGIRMASGSRAGPAGASLAATAPRETMALSKLAIRGGSVPRRAPHSTQYR